MVPYEASAVMAMILLKKYGIVTVHLAAIPPGTSALLFKFMNPETLKRFGGAERFARALKDSVDEVSEVISNRELVLKTLFADR